MKKINEAFFVKVIYLTYSKSSCYMRKCFKTQNQLNLVWKFRSTKFNKIN